MLKDTEILEAATLSSIDELTGRRYKVRLIEGDRLGSSGYYPAATLLRDGPRIFKKGTPMFLNHQTPDEKMLRPFGALENYAGELAEDAYYDGDGLYAEIEVFEDMAPMIKARKDKIGISIRARGRTTVETINGKSVPVFTELLKAHSADFVMKAGAGGKIVSILESAEDDSEAPSEVTEGSENMEILEAFKAFEEKNDARLTKIEESLAAVAVVAVVEEAKVEVIDFEAKALEIAEAFVSSTLDAEGRARVLDLHRSNNKPISELIVAEEAYVKKNIATAAEVEGEEEDASEAEESAIPMPSAWATKKKVN